MAESENIHQLTDNIYKNLLDNFNPGLRQLVSSGRAYQKSLQAVASQGKAYIDCITRLAHSAQVCKGATSDIGAALLQIAEVHKEINTHVIDNIKSFHGELLIPMDSKQEGEFKHLATLHKKYSAGDKFHCQPFEKAQINLKKHRKKTKSKISFDSKEMQYSRELNDCQTKLDNFRIQGLRQALLEERRRYSFLLDRILAMVRIYASHHNKAHELLTHRLTEWTELTKNPDVLPETSENVLQALVNYNQDDLYNVADNESDKQNASDMRRHSLDFDRQAHQEFMQTNGMMGHQSNHYQSHHALYPNSSMSSNTITIPAPPPTHARPQVRSLYTHVASADNQLSFDEGDIIALIAERRDGWQYGENIRNNQMGWFPVTFTEPLGNLQTANQNQQNFSGTRVKSMNDIPQMMNPGEEDLYGNRSHPNSLHYEVTPGQQMSPAKSRMQPTGNDVSQWPPPPPPPNQSASSGMYADNHHMQHNGQMQGLPMQESKRASSTGSSPPPPPPPPPLPSINQPNNSKQFVPPPLVHSVSTPILKSKTPHHHGNYTDASRHYVNGYHHPAGSNSPSPANSSSGYSGGSNNAVQNLMPPTIAYSNYTYGNHATVHQQTKVSQGSLRQNSVPMKHPQMQHYEYVNANDYEYAEPQKSRFSSVKLKKATTNDRSAPMIH